MAAIAGRNISQLMQWSSEYAAIYSVVLFVE